jgi:hypothetical protein
MEDVQFLINTFLKVVTYLLKSRINGFPDYHQELKSLSRHTVRQLCIVEKSPYLPKQDPR